MAGWQTARAFRMTLTVAGLLSITTLLGAWYRRGRERSETERGRKLAVVPVIAAAVWLVLLLGFVLPQLGIPNQADIYPSPMATFVTSWTLVAVLAGIGYITVTAVAWVGSGWSLWRELHASLYALALMIAILDYWKAFGRPFLEVT